MTAHHTAQDIQERVTDLLRSQRAFIVPTDGPDAPARLLIQPDDTERVWVITITGPYDPANDEQVVQLARDIGLALPDPTAERFAGGTAVHW